jgi:hypothetical protein
LFARAFTVPIVCRLYRLAFLLGVSQLVTFLVVVQLGDAAAIAALGLLAAQDRRARRFLLARVTP